MPSSSSRRLLPTGGLACRRSLSDLPFSRQRLMLEAVVFAGGIIHPLTPL
jgi:hypothetical protein